MVVDDFMFFFRGGLNLQPMTYVELYDLNAFLNRKQYKKQQSSIERPW